MWEQWKRLSHRLCHARTALAVVGIKIPRALSGDAVEEEHPHRDGRSGRAGGPYFHGNDRFYNRAPSDRLCLEITSGPLNGRRRRFTDTKRHQVENLLNTFIATLYRTAEDIKLERRRLEELRLEREQQERRRQEWERQRYEKLEEIRAEEERVATLTGEAEAWHKSQAIRTYVEAARESLIEVRREVAPGSDAECWLDWATKQADRLDPLTDSPPSVLDEKPKWNGSNYWNAYN